MKLTELHSVVRPLTAKLSWALASGQLCHIRHVGRLFRLPFQVTKSTLKTLYYGLADKYTAKMFLLCAELSLNFISTFYCRIRCNSDGSWKHKPTKCHPSWFSLRILFLISWSSFIAFRFCDCSIVKAVCARFLFCYHLSLLGDTVSCDVDSQHFTHVSHPIIQLHRFIKTKASI